MNKETNRSKRVAKNTALLYLRMIIVMMVGLYTSRVILNVLGISDYGIYNVVGGLVGMFSILSSAISSSISRYLTFQIGRGDLPKLKELFSTSFIAQLGISLLILVLIEVVGLWYLSNKMVLPNGRLDAAAFVLQCSLFSFVLGLIMTPYSAVIIAHERFSIYAYMSLLDSFMKLAVVFALSISPFDKLKTYAFLLLTVTAIVQLVYFIYCRKQFPESHFQLKCNLSLLKEVGSYAGWNFLGSTSWIINTQGVDLLINFFFGVTLNAARGIANQVNNIVQGFVTNFMTALNPQITKSYAVGDMKYMRKLVYAGAKYSFFLMLFFSIPLCLETKQILVLWLKLVPDHTIAFVRLTLIATMLLVLGNTLSVAQGATGKLKRFSIITSIFTFLEFPLVFIFFNLGYSPESCYYIHVVIYAGLVFVKIYIVKEYVGFTYSSYVREVIFKVFRVSAAAVVLPIVTLIFFEPSMFRLILIFVVSIVSSLLSICCLGMSKGERQAIIAVVRSKALGI